MKKRAGILPRDVHTDVKGFFIYYGGWRFCPPADSKVQPDMRVILQSPFRRPDGLAVVYVGEAIEIWRQRGEPNNEDPFFRKRVRGTDHYAAMRCADDEYITLVRGTK